MPKIKELTNYIFTAFHYFTLNSTKIEVDTTSTVEKAWNNVNYYINNAINKQSSK